MKFFSSNRAKRTTAFMVLLVWLFALTAGVANACLMEARSMHGLGATVSTPQNAIASAMSAGHMGVVGAFENRADDSALSKTPCLKVWDDGAQSMVKHQSTFDLTDPGLAPLFAILWTSVTPNFLVPHRFANLQPATSGLPIRVRFSRLAL